MFNDKNQTALNFQKDVIERSTQVPVVVDFWAPWCGPCRVLGPVIEELATEHTGNWELVKVNTEEHPDIAREYRVMSIPNVKMFYQGRVVSEFAGALPKSAIQQWLDRFLPSAGERELGQMLARANGWPDARLAGTLDTFYANNPEVREGSLHLARQIVLDQPERALELIRELPASPDAIETAKDIRALAELILFAGDDNPALDELLAAAREALLVNTFDDAARHLIDAVIRDKDYAAGLPRRAAIALFRMLGDDDAVTRAYRKQFDMALY